MKRRNPVSSLPELPDPRVRAFVREFLANGGKKRDAALAAGYAPKGAHVQANRLLRRPAIIAAIQDEEDARDVAERVTAAKVIRELSRVAFLDPAEFFNPDGSLKPIHEMSRDARAAIAGLDVTETESGEGKVISRLKRLRTVPKEKALEALGRATGAVPSGTTVARIGDFEIRIHIDEIRNGPPIETPAVVVTALPEKPDGKLLN